MEIYLELNCSCLRNPKVFISAVERERPPSQCGEARIRLRRPGVSFPVCIWVGLETKRWTRCHHKASDGLSGTFPPPFALMMTDVDVVTIFNVPGHLQSY